MNRKNKYGRRRRKKWKNEPQQCRKVSYPSRRDAIDALEEFGKYRAVPAKRVYRCPHHPEDEEHWHLTSQEYKRK